MIENKNQVEIKIIEYKRDKKINLLPPGERWVKYHFDKSEYNLRMARINLNLNEHKDFIKILEDVKDVDTEFNTYEWVVIMSYYAMFHSVNALLEKIGIKVGKQYTHEITTDLFTYYLYHTKIIEDELLKTYKNAEKKAKELVVSYIQAKDQRKKYQYEVNIESQKKGPKDVFNNAVDFVSRLKNIEKTLSKEFVLKRLGKKSL